MPLPLSTPPQPGAGLRSHRLLTPRALRGTRSSSLTLGVGVLEALHRKQWGGAGVPRFPLTSSSSEPILCQLVGRQTGLVRHLWFFHFSPHPTIWAQRASKRRDCAEQPESAPPDMHSLLATSSLCSPARNYSREPASLVTLNLCSGCLAT